MQKLKGATIIESIVAMVIILTCATIGFTILTGQRKSLNTALRTEVVLKMENIVATVKYENKYLNNVYEFENFEIELKILNYKNYSNLRMIQCEAFNQFHETICTYHEIINIAELKPFIAD